MYTVQVNNAPALYPIGYFPRKFRYKKEAIACAEKAIAHGASFARVEFPKGGELDFRPPAKVPAEARANAKPNVARQM